jgi:ribosome biogenesis GTPase A
VGVTGVGKSTFINLISGSNLEVGTGLKPCTTEVGPGNSFSLGDHEVILFDTPGFERLFGSNFTLHSTLHMTSPALFCIHAQQYMEF